MPSDESSRTATGGDGSGVTEDPTTITVRFEVHGDMAARASQAVEGQNRTMRVGRYIVGTDRGSVDYHVGLAGGGPRDIGGRAKYRTYEQRVADPTRRAELRALGLQVERTNYITSDTLPNTRRYVESPYDGSRQYGTEGYPDYEMVRSRGTWPEAGPNIDPAMFDEALAAAKSGELEWKGAMWDNEGIMDAYADQKMSEYREMMSAHATRAAVEDQERRIRTGMWSLAAGGVPDVRRPPPDPYEEPWWWEGERTGGMINRIAPDDWREPLGKMRAEKPDRMEKRYRKFLQKTGMNDLSMDDWMDLGAPYTNKEIDAIKSRAQKMVERIKLQRKFDKWGPEGIWEKALWITRAPESFLMRYLRFSGPIGLALLTMFDRDAGLMPALVQAIIDRLAVKGMPLNQDWKRLSGTTYDMMSLEQQHHRELGDEPLFLAEANGFHPRDSYYTSLEEVDRLRAQRGAQDYDTVGLSQRVITWGY